eukprot:TRINITY_DN4633_c0_g1_i1.p1 TRINITY_DN4633_c0_g1~~TRINITY_DN4633_c0_g1_i1.p1  ORF type:complete len:473 (-),score=71.65 TRINITY_DN4633_c0_g1_i1:514-1932(-)
MESRNSNISDLVQRFARSWRLRSVGVASDGSQNGHRLARSDNGSFETRTERSSDDSLHDPQKIYPWEGVDPKDRKCPKEEALEILLSKLFANVSALKAAYVELQAAHAPFDPEKIQIADRAVIEELKNLSELKHLYKERDKIVESPKDSKLEAEIREQQSMLKTYEVMVKNYQSQIQTRDLELEKLRQDLKEANERREKIEKKLRQRSFKDLPEALNFISKDCLSPQLFISAVHAAAKAAHEFTKLMISMMKTAEWDLDAAANSIEPDIQYAKRAHKKYAYESYVCQRIFSGFENENFLVDDCIPNISVSGSCKQVFLDQCQELQSREPFDMLTVSPDSFFGKFCRNKYLHIVHPKMEESFFGNLDQRNHILNGGHPRTPFYQSFLKLAKQVWLLQRLALSFEPRVSIFQVRKGTDFSEVFMESVVKNVELADDRVGMRPKVGFTVLPGFRLGKNIIQCQVYLTGMKIIDRN